MWVGHTEVGVAIKNVGGARLELKLSTQRLKISIFIDVS